MPLNSKNTRGPRNTFIRSSNSLVRVRSECINTLTDVDTKTEVAEVDADPDIGLRESRLGVYLIQVWVTFKSAGARKISVAGFLRIGRT